MRISARAPSPLRIARELWEYRDLLFALGERDLRLRYRQTALGVAWVVLQPLTAAGIFAFVFGRMAGFKSGGGSYFVFALAALAGWNFFSSIVTRASASLVAHPQLVTRVYFPRIILPLSVVPAALVDLVVTIAAFVIVAMILGQPLHSTIIAVPIVALLLGILALGPAMIAAALAVRFRDVQHILPVAIQMALFASPVAYAASAVPTEWLGFYNANPLVAPLELMRWALLGTPAPSMNQVGYSAGIAIAVWFVAAAVFNRAEQSFADEI